MPIDACGTEGINRALCPRAVALLTEIARPKLFGERHCRASKLLSPTSRVYVLAKLGSTGRGRGARPVVRSADMRTRLLQGVSSTMVDNSKGYKLRILWKWLSEDSFWVRLDAAYSWSWLLQLSGL